VLADFLGERLGKNRLEVVLRPPLFFRGAQPVRSGIGWSIAPGDRAVIDEDVVVVPSLVRFCLYRTVSSE